MTYMERVDTGTDAILGLDLLRDAGVGSGWETRTMAQIRDQVRTAYSQALAETVVRILGHMDPALRLDSMHGHIYRGTHRLDDNEEAEILQAAAGALDRGWDAHVFLARADNPETEETEIQNIAADLREYYGEGNRDD